MTKSKITLFFERIIEAGWLAAVVCVPLFFNIYTARTFEPDKITLLRSIAMVMILAWLVVAVDQIWIAANSDSNETWQSRIWRWIRQPMVLPTLVLVVVYIISTILSISPQVSLWGSYQRLQGTYSALSYIIVFALMAGHMNSRSQVERLVSTIIITSIPASLYGIVQRYGLDPLPWGGDVETRVASTMGNPIFIASYLIMAVPLTLSRLINSMSAIIKEEDASWGHTILSAVYIFALAVQLMTVLFSQSRGPMLGGLGGIFVMGLLMLMILRTQDADKSGLSAKEVASGVAFIFPIGLGTVIGGALGYFIGGGLENVLLAGGLQEISLAVVGGGLGGLLGLLGIYTFMAATQRGWRWMWISWVMLAILAIVGGGLLNLRGTGLDPYIDPVRQLPGLNRLSTVANATGGTGRVRVLIWDAALDLVAPHEPLGIENDPLVPADPFNALRPIFGYGPESMFNAFAYVYPPDLAYAEARGSSADRSHNETVDSLVITGIAGFLAFYYVMAHLFYIVAKSLGWTPTRSSQIRLIISLIAGSLLFGVIAYFADGRDLTFIPLGLPIGLIAGMIIHVCVQGLLTQQPGPRIVDPQLALLLIGVLGSFISHFIEVHFVFSIAATYTYFWVYAGLMVVLGRIGVVMSEARETEAAEEVLPAENQPNQAVSERKSSSRRGKKGRNNRRAGRRNTGLSLGTGGSFGENWVVWVGGQGLVMTIILMIMTFDFITPQFQFRFDDQDSMSLLWMFVITWLVGGAIALSEIAVRKTELRVNNSSVYLVAAGLYLVSSTVYFGIYYLAHITQFDQQITVQVPADVITAADVLVNGLIIFYLFLFLLLLIFALILSWNQDRRIPFAGNLWWVQAAVIVIIIPIAAWFFIWTKNIDVVRADAYLKEGDRYRGQRQWDFAIALHEKARSIDPDEDFYYLMLALDYQLMAQDASLDEMTRQRAWLKGEEIALQAREVNPYNPDNTGNMGRYYFTIGQIFDSNRFDDAKDFFEKATILAPSNVIYHNLWAQTNYIVQNYDAAIERLRISIEIDPGYPPTWALLGDTYAASGDVEKAFEAHTQVMGMRGNPDGFGTFADQFLDQRLSFYISANRLEDLVTEMVKVAEAKSDDERIPAAIARAYILSGQPDKAQSFLEEAVQSGTSSNQTIKDLANTYLSNNQFDQAQPLYEFLVERNAADIEVFSALGYIHAQRGNLDQAIAYNQRVVDQAPNDYDSLKNLALLYEQAQAFEEALQMAERAKVVAPAAEAPSWDEFIQRMQARLAGPS